MTELVVSVEAPAPADRAPWVILRRYRNGVLTGPALLLERDELPALIDELLRLVPASARGVTGRDL